MKWWKSLKKWGTETAVEVEIKALNKDVSEPVVSFLRTFNANPKRFKVVSTSGKIGHMVLHRTHPMRSFLFVDKVTKQEWSFSVQVDLNLILQLEYQFTYDSKTPRFFIDPKDKVFIVGADYLTADERELIVGAIYKWHFNRVLKRLDYGNRHALRRERIASAKSAMAAKNERERLKGVYCN